MQRACDSALVQIQHVESLEACPLVDASRRLVPGRRQELGHKNVSVSSTAGFADMGEHYVTADPRLRLRLRVGEVSKVVDVTELGHPRFKTFDHATVPFTCPKG